MERAKLGEGIRKHNTDTRHNCVFLAHPLYYTLQKGLVVLFALQRTDHHPGSRVLLPPSLLSVTKPPAVSCRGDSGAWRLASLWGCTQPSPSLSAPLCFRAGVKHPSPSSAEFNWDNEKKKKGWEVLRWAQSQGGKCKANHCLSWRGFWLLSHDVGVV